MSLAESRSGRGGGSGRGGARALFSALGFAALLALSGCGDGSAGFQPLYGTRARSVAPHVKRGSPRSTSRRSRAASGSAFATN